MEGKKCRTSMLAQEALAISGVNVTDQRCEEHRKCDNCRFRQTPKVEISEVVSDLLHSVKDLKITSLSESGYQLLKSSSLCSRKKSIIKTLLALPEGKSRDFSILDSLSRHFNLRSHFDETVRKEDQLEIWRTGLKNQHLSIYLHYLKPNGPPLSLLPVPAWFEVEVGTKGKTLGKLDYPFLVVFELQRLGLNLDTERLLPTSPLSTACELLLEQAGQKSVGYISVLKEAEKKGNLPGSNKLFFRAQLQYNGQLKLHEPEQAHDRRIYRAYGSDRFLEVSLTGAVDDKTILNFFLCPNGISVGGRSFRFFWCKKDKYPQAYVLFAEKGCGIPINEECSVSEVIARCIPPADNPRLTLGQLVKRMKLNFSGTTVGCKLPPGSVLMLEDFRKAGVAEIDGAGLLSRVALEAIWTGYQTNCGLETDRACPYSGFQGRLAG